MCCRASTDLLFMALCLGVQAPALTFQVPAAYRSGPLLTGRAVVELSVEKADGSAAFIDYEEGGTLKRGNVRITLDGYSAPVNAGAFAKLVRDGKFDGKPWGSGYASVVAGRGAAPGAQVPLEILPIGALTHSFVTLTLRLPCS